MAGTIGNEAGQDIIRALHSGNNLRVRAHTAAPAAGNQYGEAWYSEAVLTPAGMTVSILNGYARIVNANRIVFGIIATPAPARPSHVALWTDNAIDAAAARIRWNGALAIEDWIAGRSFEIAAGGLIVEVALVGGNVP